MAELDLGRIRFFDKGEHSMETEYVLWDFVTSNGSTYLYINKVNSTGKPLTDEFYWKCLAKRGLSAFEVWDIMNGGNKTESQFFDFIQSPANDAKNDYNTVVKPAIQAQGVHAQEQGDYAKAQGEAIQDDLALKASHGYESNQKTLKQVEDDTSVKMTNLLQNSSFKNGVIKPISESDGNGSASTLSINTINPISGNYDARLEVTTPSTTNNRPILYLNRFLQDKWVLNHLFYFGMSVKINSGIPILQGVADGGGVMPLSLTLKDGFNSWTVEAAGLSSFGVIYLDGRTLWDFNFDNLIVYDLTAIFGEGNEPTKEEMNLLISTLGIDYFEGEITIPAQKIMQWQLALIRKNKNAIIALGGTII